MRSKEHPLPHPSPGELAPPLTHAFVTSVAFVALALGPAFLLKYFLPVPSIALVFLPAILLSASLFGLWPSLLASLVSVLCYNFFFIPPVFSFTIADPENVVALFFFSVVAVITSNLASRVRAQKAAADLRAKRMEDIYSFVRLLVNAATLSELVTLTVRQIALMLKAHTVLLLPEGGDLVLHASEPKIAALDSADYAAAVWTWKNDRATGAGADVLPGGRMLFVPVHALGSVIAVLGMAPGPDGAALNTENRQLFDALLDQFAIASERLKLAQEREATRLMAETEKLRSALLTSLSHDLRTPLASILGSATSLKEQHDDLAPAARKDLAATIQEEAERLNRFINNLLDMTRLESGIIGPVLQVVDIAEVTGSALRRAAPFLASHIVKMIVPDTVPALKADPVLLEQVIFNLLDNAAKYTPAHSLIEITAEEKDSHLCLHFADNGAGIPESEIEHIFDKFYRVRRNADSKTGTGLGLAVCRGFMEAMGGQIYARPRPNSNGTVFTIVLPVAPAIRLDL